MCEKRKLSANETKKEFIESIHKWLRDTLDRNNNSQYKSCFTIEDNSIMCRLPAEYFTNFEIPKDTVIEMKFVTKRN